LAWDVSPAAAFTLVFAPIAPSAALAIAWNVDRSFAYSFIDEDGLVEWIQVAAYATAAVSAALVARILSPRGSRASALLYFAFAVACALAVGEELNWGQRFLNFSTPDAWPGADARAPTAVHNVAALDRVFQGTLVVLGLYGTFAPWAMLVVRQRVARLKSLSRKAMLFVPPVFVSSSFLILLTNKLMMAAGFDDDLVQNQFYGEVEELALAFGLASFTVLTYRRLRAANGTRRTVRSQ